MRLWRVSRHRELTGVGGLIASGRWHTRGNPVIYAAEHQGTAQLEWLAHLEVSSPADYPITIPYSELTLPDDVSYEEITHGALGVEWEADLAQTRRIGDEWLTGARSLLLFVPSVLVPARNVLINPRHAKANRVAIAAIFDFPLDLRLL